MHIMRQQGKIITNKSVKIRLFLNNTSTEWNAFYLLTINKNMQEYI